MLEIILRKEGRRVVELLRASLRENKVNASGNLSRSMEEKVQTVGPEARLTVSADAYIFTVEDGRGPTKTTTGKGELYPQILSWAGHPKVTIPTGMTRAQFAWAATKNIHEHGTRLFRQGGKSGVLSDVLTDKLDEQIVARIGEDQENTAFDSILKSTKK